MAQLSPSRADHFSNMKLAARISHSRDSIVTVDAADDAVVDDAVAVATVAVVVRPALNIVFGVP